MSTAKFCTQCGAKLPSNNKFCTKCGNRNLPIKRRNRLFDTDSDDFPLIVGNMAFGLSVGACFFVFLYIKLVAVVWSGGDAFGLLIIGVLCLIVFPIFGYLAGRMAGWLGYLITIIFVAVIAGLVWKILLPVYIQ